MPEWFQKVFGVPETEANVKKFKLVNKGNKTLLKVPNGDREYLVGEFTYDSLENLRRRAKYKAKIFLESNKNRLPFDNKLNVLNLDKIDVMTEMNDLVNEDACFQVASQTNCLEHPNENDGPEKGITKYKNDYTQGPACAIATAPGTFYRNYLVMPGNKPQEGNNQINTLVDLENAIDNSGDKYFTIKNGYIKMNDLQKTEFERLLSENKYRTPEGFQKNFVDKIGVGIMSDTETVIGGKMNNMKFFGYLRKLEDKFLVNQVFCSAINLDPTNGNTPNPDNIDIFARAILDAQYEATLWLAVLKAIKTGVNAVYLTLVGGGVFKNEYLWIKESIEKAISAIHKIRFPLNIYIIHYRDVPDSMFYDLENMSYDFKRDKYIYYDANMNAQDDPDMNISLRELYRKIESNYGMLDKLTKKVQKKISEGDGNITFPYNQVKHLKMCKNGLEEMIDML